MCKYRTNTAVAYLGDSWLNDDPSAVCGLLHDDKSEEFPGKAFELLAGFVFPPTAAALATFGFQVLTWFSRMAVLKFLGDDLGCNKNELKKEVVTRHANLELEDSFNGNGMIFTSTPPQIHDKDCVPYPTAQAKFCSKLGHNHLVDTSFSDLNFASLRDNNVELAWTKVKNQKVMKQLIHYSGVCMHSVQDALCLDAFPMCHKADTTPCMMACRNVLECYNELFWGHNSYSENTDEALADYVARCQRMCGDAWGINRKINVHETFNDTVDFFAVGPPAAPFLAPGKSSAVAWLPLLGVPGAVLLGTVVKLARAGQRKRRDLQLSLDVASGEMCSDAMMQDADD